MHTCEHVKDEFQVLFAKDNTFFMIVEIYQQVSQINITLNLTSLSFDIESAFTVNKNITFYCNVIQSDCCNLL